MLSTVAVAVDESKSSLAAVTWAVANLMTDNSFLQVVTVLSPINYTVTPTAPIATAGAVAVIASNLEVQKQHAEQHAQHTLSKAREVAVASGVQNNRIEGHVLPAAGGASGVAESLVEYTQVKKPDVLVLGSRGMGSFKRSLMSLIGLGSVSIYTVHNVHCPVAVYHVSKESEEEDPSITRSTSRTFLISMDDSKHSNAMLSWALTRLVKPTDKLHIISVAVSVPFPIVDETSAAAAMLETSRWEEQKVDALTQAKTLCEKAVAAAVAHGIPKDRLWYRDLLPEGGASDVANSICRYAVENGIEMLVLGSRGMGAFKRGIMSFVGLGSVSDYCLNNLQIPVIVYKE